MSRALIVYGGWSGHEPEKVAEFFKELLEKESFSVVMSDTLDAFASLDLKTFDLIIPVWTMGQITQEQLDPVLQAVAHGVGIAGCHGGMGDAFRDSVDWQFMCGGQWVAHPGGDKVRYTVNVRRVQHPVVDGIDDFAVVSEQYYMHVDPAVDVLATTRFPVADGPHAANGPVDVPVVWTKLWGEGRVFYCSLGHTASVLRVPPVDELMRRGVLWAAQKL